MSENNIEEQILEKQLKLIETYQKQQDITKKIIKELANSKLYIKKI